MTPSQIRSIVPAPDRNNLKSARELDSRISDGIHIRLLWSPIDGQVTVAVTDTKTGNTFDLPVGNDSSALDVFRHPYAYAA